MHRLAATLLVIPLLLVLTLDFRGTLAQSPPPLPNRPDSLKFAVLGDNGTGKEPQYDLARQMQLSRDVFRFGLVLMVGDSFYGSQGPADLEKKFAQPYRPLIEAGVVFRAALGNHDRPGTVEHTPLGMNGSRYYTFTRGHVRFVVLDTNFLDAKQLQWAEETLKTATEEWRICYFHHPLYGNAGRHGSNIELRVMLEPLLVKYGVHVVFAGHDHVYERLNPQRGIHHFVVGSGGQLRKGDLQPSDSTAAGFDQDQAFLLVEIDGAELFFQAISRTGLTVDSGRIRRVIATDGT
jgi:Calcineurin-like phosphoesterase